MTGLLAWRALSFAAPLLAVIALDRVSKWWVRETIWEPARTIVLVPGWLELTPVRNRGVAFGLLQDSGGLLAVAAVVGLAILGLRSWRQLLKAPAITRVALGLIGGGAVGNLVDRAQVGYVTDFIRVPHIELFQVFNVSDAGIVVGTAALVLSIAWNDVRGGRKPAAQSARRPEEAIREP
ncbi:MAG TPA: signal peptidase II [Chloroflexota bacterium]|nr:signal peptidase II [Chloroflexota bacterium]